MPAVAGERSVERRDDAAITPHTIQLRVVERLHDETRDVAATARHRLPATFEALEVRCVGTVVAHGVTRRRSRLLHPALGLGNAAATQHGEPEKRTRPVAGDLQA